ncbi:MAG: hypothetical protein ACREO0_15210, partial [Pseudoxanthomonas sp.]
MTTHKRNAALKWAALLFVLLGISGLAFSYWIGGRLVAPRPMAIGPPPVNLHAEPVVIANKPKPIHGWWISGDADKGSVLLLHGIRANRIA